MLVRDGHHIVPDHFNSLQRRDGKIALVIAIECLVEGQQLFHIEFTGDQLIAILKPLRIGEQ